jgi:hypothetical protein
MFTTSTVTAFYQSDLLAQLKSIPCVSLDLPTPPPSKSGDAAFSLHVFSSQLLLRSDSWYI